MSIRKIAVVALMATSIVAVPVAGQAAKAHHAAVSKSVAVRKNASLGDGKDGTSPVIIGVLGLAALIGGIYAISKSGSPASP